MIGITIEEFVCKIVGHRLFHWHPDFVACVRCELVFNTTRSKDGKMERQG